MTYTRLVLLRHGQTDDNLAARMQGHGDTPLNETGRAQARAASVALREREFSAIYSSDLSRATETAHIVAEPHGLPVTQDARLREIDLGSWSGRLFKDVAAEQPNFVSDYLAGKDFRRSPTGETMAELIQRAMPAIDDIVAAHQNEQVLVVSHGLVTLHLILELLGQPDSYRMLGPMGNASYSEVGIAADRNWLNSHNVSPHS